MLILPKKYEIYDNTPEKFHKYAGRNKISYSQYTSYKDEQYKGQYYAGYFMGIKDPGNVFSEYGSWCGEYLETDGEKVGAGLSKEDIRILNTIERPEGAEYEKEIVIDLLPLIGVDVVVQGFIDQRYDVEGGCVVLDFKTGNMDKKAAFYASDEYQQTTVYSFFEQEIEGNTVVESKVLLLGRKGNGMAKSPLKLSGEIKDIPTPYSKERAMAALISIGNVAKQISDDYALYNKYFS